MKHKNTSAKEKKFHQKMAPAYQKDMQKAFVYHGGWSDMESEYEETIKKMRGAMEKEQKISLTPDQYRNIIKNHESHIMQLNADKQAVGAEMMRYMQLSQQAHTSRDTAQAELEEARISRSVYEADMREEKRLLNQTIAELNEKIRGLEECIKLLGRGVPADQQG